MHRKLYNINIKVNSGKMKFHNIGNLFPIGNIQLFLTNKCSYIEFVDIQNPYEDLEYYDRNKITSIFLTYNNFVIELHNIHVTQIKGEIISGKTSEKQQIIAEFLSFKIIKNMVYNYKEKVMPKICITNISSENFSLSKILNKKQDFILSNNITIKYRPIKNKDIAYLFFDTPIRKFNIIKDTIDNFNVLFLLYFGKHFKTLYVLIRKDNEKKYYGSIPKHPFCKQRINNVEFIDYKKISFKDFVEQTYCHYLLNKLTWNLKVLVSYFISSFDTNFIDLKFLYLSIFHESLKNSYAEKIAKYKKNSKGFFCDEHNKILSFKNLLDKTSVYLNMKIDTDFIIYRNDIIHTGYCGTISNKKWLNLESQSKDVLAKLIGFNGNILKH